MLVFKFKLRIMFLGLLAYMIALGILFTLGGPFGQALTWAAVLIPLILLTAKGIAEITNVLASVSVKKAEARVKQAEATAKLLEAYKVGDNVAYLAMPQKQASSTVIVPLAARPHLYKSALQVSEVQPQALAAPGQPTRPITALEALQTLIRNSMTWCLGIDEFGRKVIVNILEAVHVLITAATGIGKTCQLANMLYQLTQANDRDYYSLYLADWKGTLLEPLADYVEDGGREAEDYVRIMATLRKITEDRKRRDLRNGHIIIGVFAEALAIRRAMTKEQLERYAADLEFCSITSREYNIFLVAEMQADYSDKDFRVSKGSFATKLNGAVLPPQARSMGFTATDLINKVASEKKRGQFLIEGPDGARVIQAPIMDLKGGDLHRLLGKPAPDLSQPLRKSEEPGRQPSNDNFAAKVETWQAEIFGGGNQPPAARPQSNVVTTTYTVLPEPTIANRLQQALQAFYEGADSVDKLSNALDCSTSTASVYLQKLEEKGYIRRKYKGSV